MFWNRRKRNIYKVFSKQGVIKTFQSLRAWQMIRNVIGFWPDGRNKSSMLWLLPLPLVLASINRMCVRSFTPAARKTWAVFIRKWDEVAVTTCPAWAYLFHIRVSQMVIVMWKGLLGLWIKEFLRLSALWFAGAVWCGHLQPSSMVLIVCWILPHLQIPLKRKKWNMRAIGTCSGISICFSSSIV